MKTEDLMRELLYGCKPPFDETNNIESENIVSEVTLRKYRIILPSNWAKMSKDEIHTYLSSQAERREQYLTCVFELSTLGF